METRNRPYRAPIGHDLERFLLRAWSHGSESLPEGGSWLLLSPELYGSPRGTLANLGRNIARANLSSMYVYETTFANKIIF